MPMNDHLAKASEHAFACVMATHRGDACVEYLGMTMSICDAIDEAAEPSRWTHATFTSIGRAECWRKAVHGWMDEHPLLPGTSPGFKPAAWLAARHD